MINANNLKIMQKKYYIQTFGCQMNVHESEKIAGLLDANGFIKASKISNSDIIIFNTCCIRDSAEQKILSKIGELKSLKQKNKNLIIVVLGCMTQQKGKADTILKSHNFIDIILGTYNYTDLVKHIKNLRNGKKIVEVRKPDSSIVENFHITRDFNHKAFVNITYGCNNYCSYCIVPYVRGVERSRSPEKIISEIIGLLKNGTKEITLLGQNVNSYKYLETDFNELLIMIDKIEHVNDFWIRFMTSHPKDLNNNIISTIANSKHICNSIHLPVQSGSNKILKLMNRKYTREKYLAIIDSIRKQIPDCGITTDIMVGFPEETEEDFLLTLDLVKKCKFLNAFTFVYSPRDGTPASQMTQVSPLTKKHRIMKLIEEQNIIAQQISHNYISKEYLALVESFDEKNKVLIARLKNGKLVHINSDNIKLIGNFINLRIIDGGISSLTGVIIL